MTLSNNNTDLVRINQKTKNKLREALPGMTDAQRLDFTFNTSIVGLSFKRSKTLDIINNFIYGKPKKK